MVVRADWAVFAGRRAAHARRRAGPVLWGLPGALRAVGRHAALGTAGATQCTPGRAIARCGNRLRGTGLALERTRRRCGGVAAWPGFLPVAPRFVARSGEQRAPWWPFTDCRH